MEASLLLCQYRAAKILFPANYCMPQIRRGFRTSWRVWVIVGLEGRNAMGRHSQWKEKPEEKYEKKGERWQEGWEDEKVEVRKRKTAYEEEM